MMYDWHKRTIEKLKLHFQQEPEFLAFLVVGSVARGDAREDSDIDFVLVVSEQEYARREAAMSLLVDANSFCEQPQEQAGGQIVDRAYLMEAAERGDERTRFQFVNARMIFSRIPDLETLLTRIASYPEPERLEKMKSYYSQLPLHLSYMHLAEYSQNAYLLSETAVALVLFGGRLLLAKNRMLYPGRKHFMRELTKAPDKPEGLMVLANQLLREPNIKHAEAFSDSILKHTDWPQPEEGNWERIHRDSVWNWRTGAVSLAEG